MINYYFLCRDGKSSSFCHVNCQIGKLSLQFRRAPFCQKKTEQVQIATDRKCFGKNLCIFKHLSLSGEHRCHGSYERTTVAVVYIDKNKRLKKGFPA